MRRTLALTFAVALAFDSNVSAQSLAARLDAVQTGTVRFSFATHDRMCGNGRFIGEETTRGFVAYTVWDRGYSMQSYEFFQPDCRRGPVRLVVIKDGGRVTGVRAGVAVEWRRGLDIPDLGMVDAGEAAGWLLDLAVGATDHVSLVAFLAASAADARIADRLIRIATDRSLGDDARERAMRWLNGAAEREGKTPEGDFALRSIAQSDAEAPAVRDRAIRGLRSSPPNEAFLRELYRRLDRAALKDRVIRRVAEHPGEETVRWLEAIVMDRSEPREARDRALRVLGSELKRFDTVRGLYGRLDHASLKDRALRVVAEQGGEPTERWLEAVALNPAEPVAARDRAVRLLGERGALDVRALYGRLDDRQLKDRVLRLAGERGDSATAAWLRDVATDAAEPTALRDRALRELAERAIASVELATLYDRVGTTELRQRVIRLLADRRDDPAVDKLISIARSDASADLRRYALRRLADTGHAKARAYLEEMVRRP